MSLLPPSHLASPEMRTSVPFLGSAASKYYQQSSDQGFPSKESSLRTVFPVSSHTPLFSSQLADLCYVGDGMHDKNIQAFDLTLFLIFILVFVEFNK